MSLWNSIIGVATVATTVAVAAAVAGVLICVVIALTVDVIRARIKQELPETSFAEIENIIRMAPKTTGPPFRVRTGAYKKNGERIGSVEFQCEKMNDIYKGQKITI